MDLLSQASGVNIGAKDIVSVSLRCPHCRTVGIFTGFSNCHDIGWLRQTIVPGPSRSLQNDNLAAGVRVCPNTECRGLVFVALKNGKAAHTFPAELEDFDASGIPEPIRDCMEEALLCHSQGCYRAAALMVRRAIEELCKDKKAAGPNLMKRIEALKPFVTLPPELFEGAHELRFLGNDAAHVDAMTYASVGKEERSLAIDIAKTLLHSVYQTGALVKRIQALKQKAGQP